MTDRILAMAALLTLIAFLSVIPIFVPDLDLIIVMTFVSGLAIWDFWPTLRPRHKNESD